MARVGISLGSNLGDRLANLRKAVQLLAPFRSSDHLMVSSLYETEPVDCAEGDPGFYNAVVEIDTLLEPMELLKETQQIELALGRLEVRSANSPRPVDLDLLYYDQLELAMDVLILPHPRMLERAFVLVPLSEIRSEYREAADQLSGLDGIERLESAWLQE
ncbi:MAG: 2-amino-4-hydroxy-6-hydroxymethyldihydropteridine diphosphokinase [Verrucomicrobiales bacterium]|nr:2-amino-4-hydroxy-6-hydroxymethyldihydropteridine diphosphokinase [Verrucomicrobiales bacterium]